MEPQTVYDTIEELLQHANTTADQHVTNGALILALGYLADHVKEIERQLILLGSQPRQHTERSTQ